MAIGMTPTWTAPLVQLAPWGRAAPRWSRGGQLAATPSPTAGLPAAGRWVWVGAPLSARARSCGLVLDLLVAAVNPQVVPVSRLPPPSVSPPLLLRQGA